MIVRAVEAAGEGDDGRAAGGARAILTAFSTASAPVDISTVFVRPLAGRERVQLFAERDVGS